MANSLGRGQGPARHAPAEGRADLGRSARWSSARSSRSWPGPSARASWAASPPPTPTTATPGPDWSAFFYEKRGG